MLTVGKKYITRSGHLIELSATSTNNPYHEAFPFWSDVTRRSYNHNGRVRPTETEDIDDIVSGPVRLVTEENHVIRNSDYLVIADYGSEKKLTPCDCVSLLGKSLVGSPYNELLRQLFSLYTEDVPAPPEEKPQTKIWLVFSQAAGYVAAFDSREKAETMVKLLLVSFPDSDMLEMLLL